MYQTILLGFPLFQSLKCALREPCADPARDRVERCHISISTKNKRIKGHKLTYFAPFLVSLFSKYVENGCK